VRIPDVPLESVVDALAQVGMFGSGRCIWIRNLGAESAEESAAFVESMSAGALPPGYTLVATSAKLDMRSKLAKWIRSAGNVVDMRIETDKRGPTEEGMKSFISARVRAAGVTRPSSAAVQAIYDRAGQEVGELAQEIDRLCLLVDESSELDPDLIAGNMRDLGQAWVFDLTAAITKRREAEARARVDELIDAGEEPLKILGALAENISGMISARDLLPRLPRGALGNGQAFVSREYPNLPDWARARFKNPWRAFFALKEAGAFEARELRRLHASLLAIDVKMKSSPADPRHLLFSFVTEACAPRRRGNAQVS